MTLQCFPKKEIVTDRFHVQKLASQAMEQERIRLRWGIIELDNADIKEYSKNGKTDKPDLLGNGDNNKQLLARSRY
jgi:transposase